LNRNKNRVRKHQTIYSKQAKTNAGKEPESNSIAGSLSKL